MRFEYPYTVTQDEEGFWLAQCPGVRGATTDDRDRDTAVAELHDALIAALGGYIERDLPLPVPSASQSNQTIALEPIHAAKLALHAAKNARGLNNSDLARLLGGISENAVRRMLDLDHRSHIGTIQSALQKLGRRLVIEEIPAEDTECV
jgi:antitoxin HicB